MTTKRLRELDESLAAFGIAYDASAEEFKKGRKLVDWHDVLALLPQLSLNDLMAYMERKQAEFAAR